MREANARWAFVLAGLFIVPVAVVLPPSAQAQEFDRILCISGEDETPATHCGEGLCNGHFATWADALAEAEVAAQQIEPSPSLKVCSVEGNGFVHFENVQIENLLGSLGRELTIDFGGTILCPATGVDLEDGAPLLTMYSDGSDRLEGLTIDFRAQGPCPQEQRPGIALSGGGVLELADIHVIESKGYAVGNGLDGLPANVRWSTGTVTGAEGPVVRTSGSFLLGRVELAGGQVGGEAGGPAFVVAEGEQGSIELVETVFFGNLVDGSGDEEVSAVDGYLARAHRVSFLANAMIGGAPLLRLGYSKPGYQMNEGTTLIPTGEQLQDIVFSRNRQIVDTEGSLPLFDPTRLYELDEQSCAGGTSEVPYVTRPSPWDGLTEGSGPLVVLDPERGAQGRREFVLARSFFVQNSLGGEPVILADADGEDVRIQLLQSTFADNGGSQALRVLDARNSGEVLALRNLFLGPVFEPSESERESPWIEVGGEVGRAFVSMNISPSGDTPFELASTAAQSVLGPNLSFEELFLEDEGTWRQASACSRFQRLCPGADAATCLEWVALGQAYPCAIDTAAAYLPTEDFVASLGSPWPWSTPFFEVETDGGWAEPGASGWSCLAPRGSVDVYFDEGQPVWGDGDGQPDALDCDNEDPDVLAVWPEFDGYATLLCDPPEDSCYVCPEGSELPSEPDPDPQGATPAADSGFYLLDPGCSHRSGCGMAWSCESGSLSLALLALLLPAARRRRSP